MTIILPISDRLRYNGSKSIGEYTCMNGESVTSKWMYQGREVQRNVLVAAMPEVHAPARIAAALAVKKRAPVIVRDLGRLSSSRL